MDESVVISVGALPREWDFRSATWDLAVDSVGDQQFWPESGGGPVVPLASADWDPLSGDSLVGDSLIMELDSADVALISDSAGVERGIRIDAVTEGVRLDLVAINYYVSARPSVNPDTIIELEVATKARTFMYHPLPEPPEEDEIRVGGVPAWRTLFTLNMPETLNGPPELCQQLQCPLTITPESLISAVLVLTTQAPPPGFQPTDSVRLDVREVLEPSRLPKSPLSGSLSAIRSYPIPLEEFQGEAGVEVEVPMGPYVESLIAENAESDVEVAPTVALLSVFEPLELYFASFDGPESPTGPKLRLILTFAEDLRIR